ncbi:MAG: helix-turn-helix domain-containing protein [Nitrososphaeraceae archaeon]
MNVLSKHDFSNQDYRISLARRLKELEKGGILERQAYNEIPPRVEYRLTAKGQELLESVINLLQWMRKWSKSKS